jgi:hypothetical protein
MRQSMKTIGVGILGHYQLISSVLVVALLFLEISPYSYAIAPMSSLTKVKQSEVQVKNLQFGGVQFVHRQ